MHENGNRMYLIINHRKCEQDSFILNIPHHKPSHSHTLIFLSISRCKKPSRLMLSLIDESRSSQRLGMEPVLTTTVQSHHQKRFEFFWKSPVINIEKTHQRQWRQLSSPPSFSLDKYFISVSVPNQLSTLSLTKSTLSSLLQELNYPSKKQEVEIAKYCMDTYQIETTKMLSVINNYFRVPDHTE